jgi:hypothetical protein
VVGGWWLVVGGWWSESSVLGGGAVWLAPVGDALMGPWGFWGGEVSGRVGLFTAVVGGMDGWKGAGLGERSEGRAGCEGRCRKGKPEKYGHHDDGSTSTSRTSWETEQSHNNRQGPRLYLPCSTRIVASGADPRIVVFPRAVSLHVVVEDRTSRGRGDSTTTTRGSGKSDLE